MGIQYDQLSMEERCHIALLRKEGRTIGEIATTMDRSPSSISRELKRNITPSNLYKPDFANLAAKSRRWTGSKLDRDPELMDSVLCLLKQGHSPEQISGRLALVHGRQIISYESIYRFIYAQIQRTKDYSWRHYLPQSKFKRGRRRAKRTGSVNFIKNRVSIHARPQEVLQRTQLGHWEADLMLFSKYGQAIMALHDRSSRLLILTKQPNKSASQVIINLLGLLEKLPPIARRSITFDNGTEFSQHYLLKTLGVDTFFCDPHAPWQKGGVENAIGRIRRVLPRKTDITKLSHFDLQSRVIAYNHTPRKCLGYLTPAEVFTQQLLHFKCESTVLRYWEWTGRAICGWGWGWQRS